MGAPCRPLRVLGPWVVAALLSGCFGTALSAALVACTGRRSRQADASCLSEGMRRPGGRIADSASLFAPGRVMCFRPELEAPRNMAAVFDLVAGFGIASMSDVGLGRMKWPELYKTCRGRTGTWWWLRLGELWCKFPQGVFVPNPCLPYVLPPSPLAVAEVISRVRTSPIFAAAPALQVGSPGPPTLPQRGTKRWSGGGSSSAVASVPRAWTSARSLPRWRPSALLPRRRRRCRHGAACRAVRRCDGQTLLCLCTHIGPVS